MTETLTAEERQLTLSYLKLEGLHVGLLLNFNSVLLMNGIQRVLL